MTRLQDFLRGSLVGLCGAALVVMGSWHLWYAERPWNALGVLPLAFVVWMATVIGGDIRRSGR